MQRSPGSSSRMMALIPGMLSTHHSEMNRPDFRKRQILEQMSVGKALSAPQDIIPTNTSAKVNQLRQGNQVPDESRSARGSANVVDRTAAASTKYRVDATQPKWITNDRQVLRFYGYFQEKALENGRETLRTRRVVLCFYLSDSTLSISEPRVANSGIAQGEFMKRTVVSKPNGAKFSPEDFKVGGDVRLYGRVFHLVDCDETTRTFYDEAMGTPLASPRKYPDDLSSHVDEIEAIKLRLRAKTASAAESKAEATRKFHENSQKVLRFFVSWHDPHPLYPETRKYVLHYYLCDDTIEVIEPREGQRGQHHQYQQQQQQMGGGGHHFAVLISRRRVVRDDSNQVQTLLAERPTGKALLTDRDLRCGEWITILSRKFLLEDCDPFTREYYLTTHGVTQESCELQASAVGVKPSKWKLFQAKAHVNSRSLAETGLGQPGISPALLQRLQSHVQDNQDLNNNKKTTLSNSYQTLVLPTTMDNSFDRKQLRFRAKFHGLSKSDINFGREFTLTYYLEDDTLCVFEPRIKNSGVTGGRFLDRGRFRKCQDRHGAGDTTLRESQKERSAYCASDFYIGAIVRFEFSPNQRLELVEADQQTLSYCESNPELFPFSNSRLVVDILAKALLGSKSSADLLRRECRNVDKTGRRVLTLDEFRRVLERFRLVGLLNAQQLLTLARKFASEEPLDASVNATHSEPLAIAYDEFCDAITRLLLAMNPNAAQLNKDTWLRKIAKVPNLRTLLRRSDAESAQVVSGDAFLKIVSFYHVGLSASDLEALMSRFSRNGAVEYHRLCDAVFQHSSSQQSSTEFSLRQQTSSRQHQQDEPDDEFNFDGDELAQHCEPPGSVDLSPHRTTPAVPKLYLQSSKAQQQKPSSMALAAPRQPGLSGQSRSSDARVVAILRRVFGSRKYQLRKALRERDVDKTGQLGEEEFMEAVLSVEPSLSDDDTYAIADAYFPTNNCQLDYSQLLESAFKN